MDKKTKQLLEKLEAAIKEEPETYDESVNTVGGWAKFFGIAPARMSRIITANLKTGAMTMTKMTLHKNGCKKTVPAFRLVADKRN